MIRMIGLALAVVATVSDAPERLVTAMPAGFVAAFSDHRGQMTIEERIPRGETVERWSRMVTVQRFAGGAQIGSHGLLDRIADGLKQGCSGSATTPVNDVMIDGRTVSMMRADCPRNPETGKPEVFFAKVFTGATDLYSVQFAFRSIPSPAEAVVAQTYLDAAALCPGDAKACSENQAE